MTAIRILPLVLVALSFVTGCTEGNGPGPFGGDGGGGNGLGTGGNQPGMTFTGATGPDGCPVVALDPAAWRPLYAAYEGGVDPFFHLHSTEDTLFFGAEMYTEYGAGWTGDVGTFAPDCGANGICVYFIPDGLNVTRAVAGEVDVVSLSEAGGVIESPSELVFREMTFEATAEGSDLCFHVEQVTLRAD